jgi:hypothetical protein
MSRRAETLLRRIEAKAARGHRGDPVGTVAFYGPDDRRATKLVVGFSPDPALGITDTCNWSSANDNDVREDATIMEAALKFLRAHEVRSIVMTAGVFGCPHEPGVDFPEGGTCEKCQFWKNHVRDLSLIG